MLSERAEKGAEKASILLLSLGEDAAAEIMRHLNPKEVQRLGSKMTRTSNISLERPGTSIVLLDVFSSVEFNCLHM